VQQQPASAHAAGATPIQAHYAALGGPSSVLGWPTGPETALPDGAYANYQRGVIYYSPASNAREVHGLIGGRWSGLGAQTSFLGYPLTDELGTPDGRGRFNVFQGGSVYFSPASGSFEVHGAIRNCWAALGYETGVLGYPVSDEYAVPGGRHSDFQHGSVHWSDVFACIEARESKGPGGGSLPVPEAP